MNSIVLLTALVALGLPILGLLFRRLLIATAPLPYVAGWSAGPPPPHNFFCRIWYNLALCFYKAIDLIDGRYTKERQAHWGSPPLSPWLDAWEVHVETTVEYDDDSIEEIDIEPPLSPSFRATHPQDRIIVSWSELDEFATTADITARSLPRNIFLRSYPSSSRYILQPKFAVGFDAADLVGCR